jgi:diphosphomevalonate decarboxylase
MPIMRATAIAQPNIALIKYWGKRDSALNLPAVGSISITLSELFTEMTVCLDSALRSDELLLNGERKDDLLPRISSCLDWVLGQDRDLARVTSRSNFPIAAGLASSASAFAALTVAATAAAQRSHSTAVLSGLAGQASGSAARSLYGGFAELRNVGNGIVVSSLCAPDDWPLCVVVAITATGPKTIGSTAAMEYSRRTSPFYTSWVEQQSADLDAARAAILQRDFPALATIAEHNCLKMHSVMWASRPPMMYWNAATISCMQTVRELQDDGCSVFFTIDAGPQIKAVCLPTEAARVRAALASTPGVVDTMCSDLGAGARLMVQA